MPLRYAATMRPVSPTRSRAPLAVVGLVALAVVACGGGTPTPRAVADPSSTTATPPTASAATASSTAASPTGRQPALDRPDLAAVKVDTRSRSAASRRRCGSVPCPTAAGACSSPSRAAPSASSRTASCSPTPFLDISDRDRRGRRARPAGRRVPAGLRHGAPAALRPLLGPQRRHHDRVLRRARPTPRPSTRRPSGSSSTKPSRIANHNGGWIGFDPDGMLLIALGDGGSRRRPREPGQRTWARSSARCSGSTSSARPPASRTRSRRTTRSSGGPDARPEILHYGLRNPFRDSIDPETGDLWIGDVGPERVGGGRRRAGERARPRLRLAALGGAPLLRPAAGLRSRPA